MIVLYTIVLVAVTLLPYVDPDERRPLSRRRARRSGRCSWATPCWLYRDYSDELARATFRYSIVYLAALFSALLIDHYWQ